MEPKKNFQEGPKVVKFRFTHLKQRKRPIFAKKFIGKCQIWNDPRTPFGRPCTELCHSEGWTQQRSGL